MARLLSDGAALAFREARARDVGTDEITYGRSPEFHFAGACATCGDVGYPHLVVRSGQMAEVEGLTALGQWIRAALITDREAFPIYGNQFGSDYTSILGLTTPEVTTLAERMTAEALLVDDRIRDVSVRAVSGTLEISITTFDGAATSLRALPSRRPNR